MGEVIAQIGVRSLADRIRSNIGVLQTTVAELITDERHQR